MLVAILTCLGRVGNDMIQIIARKEFGRYISDQKTFISGNKVFKLG